MRFGVDENLIKKLAAHLGERKAILNCRSKENSTDARQGCRSFARFGGGAFFLFKRVDLCSSDAAADET